MKKSLVLPDLTEQERKRLLEIKMFLLVQHLFKTLGDTTTTHDIIENLCIITGTSLTLIKTIISNMRAINSTIAPGKSEIAVMLYRGNLPVSAICNKLDISPNTVYAYIDAYYQTKEQEFQPRIKAEYFSQIEKFTKLIGDLCHDELSI